MNTSETPISLEQLTSKDIDGVYKLFNNEQVLRSYPVKPISGKDETKDFILKITSNGCWSWKITRQNDPDSFMGVCSLHHFDRINKSIEIGGTLFPEYWGGNIMKQAFLILIEKAVQDFGIQKIIGKTRTANLQAIQLVKKLGFEVFESNDEETILHKDVNQI